MSAIDPNEGSEDVQEFLKRIRELSEKRDREDAERTRKLEEDILEGRRQREARRLERARSLSPEKQSRPGSASSRYASPRLSARPDLSASPLGSPRLLPVADDANGRGDGVDSPVKTIGSDTPSRLDSPALKPRLPARNEMISPPPIGPRPSTAVKEPIAQRPKEDQSVKQVDQETLSKLESPAPKPLNETSKPALPPKPANIPERGGLLSWQQRPGSLRGVRSRPISLTADRAPSPLTKSASVPEPESMSRDAIAKSLGSKDAMFFRQTADRGNASAAYRKNQVEDTDVVDLSANRMKLHGLRNTSEEEKEVEERTEPVDASSLASPPPTGLGKPRAQTPVRGSNTVRASWASPVPTQASQVFSQPTSPETAMPYKSATLGRSSSPTKGVGSFVQSAMAKRSDSVGKRWSAQSTPSKNQDADDAKTDNEDILASPPSPSKRFGPVKASWLESALTRPEAPKVSDPQQPSWMAELQRNKMQRSSVNVTSAMKQSIAGNGMSSASDGGRTLAEIQAKQVLPEKKPKPVIPEKLTTESKENVSQDIHSGSELGGTARNKPKPTTPPKKDFRSTLKPIDTSADTSDKSELEFRNAAGKLKRTVTQNYVAPDILKENITRGKAGLALTDGPQKSPIKDEFKDSLLKQKETMQARGGEASRSRSTSPVKRSTTPEAIARRRTMASKASAPDLRAVAASEAAEKLEAERDTRASANKIISPQPLRKEPAASSKLADRFNPNLASMLARGPSPFVPGESSGRGPPTRSAETRSDSPEVGDSRPLQHMTKGRAKGPKRRAPKTEAPATGAAQESRPPLPRKSSSTVRSVSGKPRVVSSSRNLASPAIQVEPESEPGAKLSDRRKSQSWPIQTNGVEKAEDKINGSAAIKSSSSAIPPKPSKPNGLRSTSGTVAPEMAKIDEDKEKTANTAEDGMAGLSVKGAAAKWGRPMTMEKKKETASLSSPIEFKSTKAERSTSSSSLLVPEGEGLSGKTAPSPRTPQPGSKPAGLRSASATLKTPTTTEANGTPSTTSSKPSPIPRTTEAGRLISDFFENPFGARTHLDVDTNAILTAGSAQDMPKLKTLRKTIVQLHPDGKTSPLPSQQDHVLFSASMYLCTHIFGNATTGARVTELYLWTGADVSSTHIDAATSHAKTEAKKASATYIHLPQGQEAVNFLQALGGILVTRNGSYSSSDNKSYLLRGRRHFGHLTFDEVELSSTSLCPGFPYILIPPSKGASSSGPSKIYLWKGTGAHHEEVAGARLMAMDIGALADIVEVDCGAETSEFLSLLPDAAPGKSKPNSGEYAAYWSQKAQSENYRVRLFEISASSSASSSSSSSSSAAKPNTEHEQLSTVSAFWRAAAGKPAAPSHPSSSSTSSSPSTTIKEIIPFSQSSLLPTSLYVLDAYFALYLLVGSQTQQEFQAFSAALLFVQDYAILAASGEDRPSVPKGWVVFGGEDREVGSDVRACFRRWVGGEKDGTNGMKKGKGGVVPVDSCIAACKGV